ncbi:hypothetical protein SEA_ANON_17 [Gordonia phage Anon]|nr:hypothetical protein SEA_ANON_17 [Gordonia phage Anon]
MELKSKQNGGIVVVDSGFGERLLAGGGWEEVVEAPVKKTPAKKKTAPTTEE